MSGDCVNFQRALYGHCTGSVRSLYGDCDIDRNGQLSRPFPCPLPPSSMLWASLAKATPPEAPSTQQVSSRSATLKRGGRGELYRDGKSSEQRLSRWSLLQRIAQLFSAYSKRQVSSDNTKVATTHILGIGRWEEGRLRHPLYSGCRNLLPPKTQV